MSIKVPGCQDLKVLGFKGDKGNKVTRVTRVTRVPRLKGLLRDRVFSRTHLRSSLTPEEGPSCCYQSIHKNHMIIFFILDL